MLLQGHSNRALFVSLGHRNSDMQQELHSPAFAQPRSSTLGITGSALDQANSRLQVAQPAVAQARNLRQQMSGVSLDEEASVLIQFQRAYEANSRLITVMYQLTQDTIDMMR